MNHRPLWLSLLSLALTCCLTLSCSQTSPKADKRVKQHQPELWPTIKSPFDPAETAAINAKVAKLLSQMTLEQKVGQMVQAEMGYITPEQVKHFHIGSVLEGGGSYLHGNKSATISEWVANMDSFWLASVDASGGRLPIPIIWGTDAVHGHNKVIGATIFPHNIGLGATNNPELVRKISEVTALEVLVAGKDWTFSPEISVTRNDRWGRTYEGYSEDAALVATLGAASIEGYQGSLKDGTFMNGTRLIATAKHYVGDGGTVDGVDRADNLATEQELIDIHAPGYFSAIEAGVLSIMASHSSWQGTRMHGHKYLLQDILKDRLGFDGFVIGDWNSHALIPGCVPESCPESINAGVDMFMVPEHWQQFIENTLAQVRNGEVTEARIDDAVTRILRTKFRAGVMDAPRPSERRFANKEELLGAPEHRALARQAVRESLVLLKNNEQTLPLPPKQNVLVVGDAANNIGQQCGGWTISWQGTGTTNADFPNGTSILQAIKDHVEPAGGKVTYSPKGIYKAGANKPDVAVVIYGETPYSEWQGDRKTLEFESDGHPHAKLLRKLKLQGIKTVSVFISGRPLWVNPELNASDAFVAAWLPGTEGGGISDLLFKQADGSMPYDFTGTLALSWPKLASQGYLNVGDENYDPLFPFGYGLSYKAAHANLGMLSTDNGVDESAIMRNQPLFKGRAIAPWSLFVQSGKSKEVYKSSLIQLNSITVAEADQETQGDAIDIQWHGKEEASVALEVPGISHENFEEHLNNKSIISFDIYKIKTPTAPVEIELDCGDPGCNKRIDVTYKVSASPKDEWNQLSVDLACYKDAVNLKSLKRSFSMITRGEAHFRLANITVRPGMADKASFRCQN